MHDFFRARIAEEKRFQEDRLPFRKKFFADECRYDSRVDTIRKFESEKVIDVDEGKFDSHVITEQAFHYSGGEKTIRLRYQLQATADDWLIRSVQTACYVCDGRGDRKCPVCNGKRWR